MGHQTLFTRNISIVNFVVETKGKSLWLLDRVVLDGNGPYKQHICPIYKAKYNYIKKYTIFLSLVKIFEIKN